MKRNSARSLNPEIFTLISAFVFFLGSCDKLRPSPYPNAEPNNMDDELLVEVVENAALDSGILSLIIYRNNDIIVEEYFEKGGADSLHRVKSVTKSVTSILVGMAIDKGYIKGLDETVEDYLSEYLRSEDSIVAKVTIGQLLTMTGGFDWNELSDPEWIYWNNWVRSEDLFLYALQVPIIHEPGTQFTYCTSGCQILSGIFTEATGVSLKSFAEEFLFTPLGILGERPWGDDVHGFNYGGVTLNLTARDMLQIGKLYLNLGEYNGQKLVSESWVTNSSSSQVSTGNVMYFATDYGYYWWIGEQQGIKYYFANGYGGQFICVFPEWKLIVVAQSELSNEYRDSGQQWFNTLSLIMNQVFNSVIN